MKFVHSADWQIGMKAAHVGDAGRRVREERLKAAARVVEQARALAAEFIVLAGDTFEHNAIDRVLVQSIADILTGFHNPVFIIPGNHDPLVPGSVWEHPAWKSSPQIYVLREPAPVSLDGVEILPCPIYESRSRRDPSSWIPPERRDCVRIGLAHGTVEGILADEVEYPIPRDAATRHALDYLALGHWHSETRFPDADGAPRMAYSGTHETSKFGERNSGNALLVEIPRPGAAPILTLFPTGGLRWETLTPELSAPGELTQLRASIEALPNAGATLLEVRLGGLLFASEHAELARIDELIAARFLFGRVESALRPAPGDTQWVENLPDGVLRDTALQLMQYADPSFAGQRPEAAGPAEASQALIELYKLATEVRG